MRRSSRSIVNEQDQAELQRLAAGRNTPQKVAQRARIILLSGDGVPTGEMMERLGVSTPTISRWRERYRLLGVPGILTDRTRPGRKARLSAEQVRFVVETTLHEQPPEATQWSVRSMAKRSGVSPSSVHSIWKDHGLKPHRVKSFKLSKDPEFVDKLMDVVGLYLDPPEKAVVFSVDEKSQIQALERTQPGLPMKRGRAGTMTHDYKRHGVTTLFAALNVLTGDLIGACHRRHRHDEFLSFLKLLDRQTPAGLDLHVILDNYATHKHPHVRAWLARHPRVILHFTPTSASWLNLVERFFGELTQRRLKRGVFHAVKELEDAIYAYLAHRNLNPKPYTWTAPVQAILDKVKRANEALGTLH